MSFSASDPRFDEQPQSPVQTRERSGGRGCFFWGCLTLALVFLALLIGILLALYFTAKHYINKYTSDAPMEIAVVELSEEEIDALKGRFEAFEASIKEGGEAQDLEVSAEEINALIAEDEDLKGRVLVRISDGRVGGDISFPMDDLPGGGGRYLNATADFDVSMEGGVLMVTLADATVNGSPLPQPVMQQLSGQNLAKDAYKDRENAEVLRKFESIEVVGDKIILKARPKPPAEPVAAEIESMDEAVVPVESAP